MTRQNMTRDNAPHLLLCAKGLGRAHWHYYQPCHILKEMPDGERVKVSTFGYQNSASFLNECRTRYVHKSRVHARKG